MQNYPVHKILWQYASPFVIYISDVAYSDGKTGDYLFLGNFVYTVSIAIF